MHMSLASEGKLDPSAALLGAKEDKLRLTAWHSTLAAQRSSEDKVLSFMLKGDGPNSLETASLLVCHWKLASC